MAKRTTPTHIIEQIIDLHNQGLSSRKICDALDWKRSKKEYS